MKALSDASSALRADLGKLKDKRTHLDGQIYQLEEAIKSLDRVAKLKRIRHVKYEILCRICKEPFEAKVQSAKVCTKPACRKTAADERRTK